jgi:hypothetical protein
MMMKVSYVKVLRETYNIRTRYLCYHGGFVDEGEVYLGTSRDLQYPYSLSTLPWWLRFGGVRRRRCSGERLKVMLELL